MRELKEKVRRLTEADKQKNDKITQLETDSLQQTKILGRVEEIIGADRLDSLRNDNVNQTNKAPNATDNRRQAVGPAVRDSKTCVVM